MNLTASTEHADAAAWRRFALVFLRVFGGGTAIVALLILLVDPYGVVPFSLPIERRIVSISQRHMYPQRVRSGLYDSLIVGSSTSRLLDPERLNGPFGARFVNMAMDSMQAWEQRIMIDLFLRTAGAPKVLLVGIDAVWCNPQADQLRGQHGFPEWMYDDDRWNDLLHLLNTATAEITGRMIGNQLGLYGERVRQDGYGVFVPPEEQYDLAKARRYIWGGKEPWPAPDVEPPALTARQREALSFPALPWLEESLAKLPPIALTILAYMPVHVAAQPRPGTRHAAAEAECKARIADIARRHGAKVVDWRIASPLTREDRNYWDPLHYRVPIATRLSREIVEAVLEGKPSSDGSYRLVVP